MKNSQESREEVKGGEERGGTPTPVDALVARITAEHLEVARYRVYVSRRDREPWKTTVAADRTFEEAMRLRDAEATKLRATDPEAGRFVGPIACIELENPQACQEARDRRNRPFRPDLVPSSVEGIQRIFNAIASSRLRDQLKVAEWIVAERAIVRAAAAAVAADEGLPAPSEVDINTAEILAMGEESYLARWATGVYEFLLRRAAQAEAAPGKEGRGAPGIGRAKS